MEVDASTSTSDFRVIALLGSGSLHARGLHAVHAVLRGRMVGSFGFFGMARPSGAETVVIDAHTVSAAAKRPAKRSCCASSEREQNVSFRESE
jgi:hypothetical protein